MRWTDLPPHAVVRKIRDGKLEEVLAGGMIWACASCLTCSARCPNGVPVAELMDVLKQESVAAGVAPAMQDVAAAHTAFLAEVLRRGRLHEISLITRYKLKTGHWFQDMWLGAALFLKGRLKLLPERVEIPEAIEKARLRKEKK